jgi:uncharacterized Tic20 family protein
VVTLRPAFGERILATLAHLLTVFSIPGIFATAIIWVVARKGTPYLRHHARQALRWQLLVHLLVIALVGLCIAVIVGAGLTNHGGSSDATSLNASFGATLLIIGVIAISGTMFALTAVVGAIPALLSRTYRYRPGGRTPRAQRAAPSVAPAPSAAAAADGAAAAPPNAPTGRG